MKGYPHEALGRILLDMGRLDEAVAALSTAVENDPGFAQAHVSLGRALMARGDFEAAIVILPSRASEGSAGTALPPFLGRDDSRSRADDRA